jgi:uncharacterized membrane protein
MHFFARNEAINNWLADNPVILGSAALVLGLILVVLGVRALVTGRATAKRGPDLQGANAKAMGIVWAAAGSLCLLFGLYKIVSGLL